MMFAGLDWVPPAAVHLKMNSALADCCCKIARMLMDMAITQPTATAYTFHLCQTCDEQVQNQSRLLLLDSYMLIYVASSNQDEHCAGPDVCSRTSASAGQDFCAFIAEGS